MAAASMMLAACGKSDKTKVEDAIRVRERAHVVHDVSCRDIADRRWRCVLRTDNLLDGRDKAATTVVCSVVVASSANTIERYQCRY
jgi:hypothetical protein